MRLMSCEIEVRNEALAWIKKKEAVNFYKVKLNHLREYALYSSVWTLAEK